MPTCKNPADLRFGLKKFGIELEYKFKRGSSQIKGVSFRYNDITFNGSQIDRKFSYGSLKKEFHKNIELLQEQVKKDQKQLEIQAPKKERQTVRKPKTLIIGGIEPTSEQGQTLEDGGFIYYENMQNKDGTGRFSLYIFLNTEKTKAFFSKKIRMNSFNMENMRCRYGIRY